MNKEALEKSEIVELAWADDVSFDSIRSQTGYSEAEVIKLMRASLKPSSFRLWRKRVSGRVSKHASRTRHDALSTNRNDR